MSTLSFTAPYVKILNLALLNQGLGHSVGFVNSIYVVDRNTNTIYVANSDDNTVCQISSGTPEIDGTPFTIFKEVTNDANRNN
jgi:hypothetical protein